MQPLMQLPIDQNGLSPFKLGTKKSATPRLLSIEARNPKYALSAGKFSQQPESTPVAKDASPNSLPLNHLQFHSGGMLLPAGKFLPGR